MVHVSQEEDCHTDFLFIYFFNKKYYIIASLHMEDSFMMATFY